MKARHFKQIRKQLTSKNAINLHIQTVKQRLKTLHNFQTFECSEFFRGKLLAKLNQEEYDQKYKKTVARLNYLQYRLQRLTKPPVTTNTGFLPENPDGNRNVEVFKQYALPLTRRRF